MDFARPFTDQSFFLIAGPCVIESRDHALFLAAFVVSRRHDYFRRIYRKHRSRGKKSSREMPATA